MILNLVKVVMFVLLGVRCYSDGKFKNCNKIKLLLNVWIELNVVKYVNNEISCLLCLYVSLNQF